MIGFLVRLVFIAILVSLVILERLVRLVTNGYQKKIKIRNNNAKQDKETLSNP